MEKWREFWTLFAEDFVNNQVSVGCFDAEKSEELVGISVAKDLQYVPAGFDDQYMKSLNFISPIIRLEDHMLSLADAKIQPILAQRGLVMDIWGVALKKQHMGKRLLHKMMDANEYLGEKAGYEYSFCYASNFKTGISLKKLHFHKIAEANAANFHTFGVRPF